MAVIPDGPFIGAVFSHDGGALRCAPLGSTAPPSPPSGFEVENVAPSCGRKLELRLRGTKRRSGGGGGVLMMLMEWMH